MTTRPGLRVGLVGATGALGNELLEVLGERRFPVAELVAVATDDSLGATVELDDVSYPVETEPPSLRGLDLLFLCAPQEAAREWLRLALHAEVPCLDLSGALGALPEVPLVSMDLAPDAEALEAPILALPPGLTLAWLRVLAPIQAHAGLRRVVATSLESVSGAGRHGLETLQAEVLALFNQSDPPERSVFPCPVAFDCVPQVGEAGDGEVTSSESGLVRDLKRLLGQELPFSVTAVQVPTFAGSGASLVLETERALPPAELADLLGKVPGVELWDERLPGPTTREPVGRDVTLVGRVRREPGTERGLLLWLAADPVRIAAVNAVRVAESRFPRS